jgi:integrase
MKYPRLTKRIVAQLAAPDPSGKQTLHWCGELRGFYVRVSGSTPDKTYGVFGRPNGRQRFVKIGPCNVLDLDDARERAKQIIGDFFKGIDPKLVAAERAAKEAKAAKELTLRSGLDAFLTARKSLRPSTVTYYRRGVQLYLADWLDMPLRSITGDMVEVRHREIQREVAERRKTTGGFRGEVTANAAMIALRTVYNFAVEVDESLPRNPTRRLRRGMFPVERRTRMVRAEELGAFYGAVDALQNRAASDVLKLMLFSGLRLNEATALKWSEIDFGERVIRLPPKRVKAKRPFTLPLSDYVRDLLVARRAIGVEGAFVFPGDGMTGHLCDVRPALATVAKESGVKITAHDLRRTFLTVAAGSGVSLLELKKLVNHSVGADVTAGYVVFHTDSLREPAQRVADRMKQLCDVKQPEGVARLERR